MKGQWPIGFGADAEASDIVAHRIADFNCRARSTGTVIIIRTGVHPLTGRFRPPRDAHLLETRLESQNLGRLGPRTRMWSPRDSRNIGRLAPRNRQRAHLNSHNIGNIAPRVGGRAFASRLLLPSRRAPGGGRELIWDFRSTRAAPLSTGAH